MSRTPGLSAASTASAFGPCSAISARPVAGSIFTPPTWSSRCAEVDVLARGVDHQQQMVALVGDHQVVEDPAVGRGEQRVALPALLQPDHVDRHQRLRAPRPHRGRAARSGPCGSRRTARLRRGCAGVPSSRPAGYCTGISQPAKGTIFAPSSRCRSYRAVRLRSVHIRLPAGRARPASLGAEAFR